jgi:hypothetical protein
MSFGSPLLCVSIVPEPLPLRMSPQPYEREADLNIKKKNILLSTKIN